MSNRWASMTKAQRLEALKLFQKGVPNDILCEQFSISTHEVSTFLRSMRAGRMWAEILSDETPGPLTSAKPTEIDHEALKRAIRNKPRSLLQLSQRFDRSEQTIYDAIEDLRTANYNIVEIAGSVVLDTKAVLEPSKKGILIQKPTQEIVIGVASDIHWGSTEQQITALISFISTAYHEFGVREVFVPGDLTAGIKVYRGQFHDLYLHTADMQRDAAVIGFPRYEDLTYHCIGGNHDYDFLRQIGYNIVEAICARREDMRYYGFDLADIPLTTDLTLRMFHPSGSSPYALSYRLQKSVEQMALEQLEKAVRERTCPTLGIVLAGHLHTSLYARLGNIRGFQCGCFEGQTNYLKRKALYPAINGWIISLKLTKDGLMKRIVFTEEPYPQIKNDWENYPELKRIREQREVSPIFEYVPDEEENKEQ